MAELAVERRRIRRSAAPSRPARAADAALTLCEVDGLGTINSISGIAGRTGFAGSLLRNFELVLSHATAKLIMVTRRPIYLTAIELRADSGLKDEKNLHTVCLPSRSSLAKAVAAAGARWIH